MLEAYCNVHDANKKRLRISTYCSIVWAWTVVWVIECNERGEEEEEEEEEGEGHLLDNRDEASLVRVWNGIIRLVRVFRFGDGSLFVDVVLVVAAVVV